MEGAKDPKESTAVTRALLEVFSAWCRFVIFCIDFEVDFCKVKHFRAEEKRIKKSSSEGDGDEVFEKWNKWLRKRAEEAMAALSKVGRVSKLSMYTHYKFDLKLSVIKFYFMHIQNLQSSAIVNSE